MKKLLLFLTLTFTSLIVFGQTTVSYEYDQAGNRIVRKVITLEASSAKKHVETPDTAVVNDKLGEQEVSIYPNPTRGHLGVEIKGMEETEIVQITIYNGQGAVMYNKPANAGINSIDLRAYSTGWYIMRLESGETRKEYKIIKQ
ncbi:MAG: T9SS type A sorting domain-containing protein [Paludibacter sp.]|nr:T9SS type A sorting domain-containing protein [Paludibacter sp.]